MEQLYCMNCLRQIPAYPCPLCGYDPVNTPRVPQALEQSILRGRYLTGRVLEKNSFEIVYRGLDLAENKPVTLREFFPAAQAERLDNGLLKWNSQENQESVLNRVRQRLSQDAIVDSFSENSTVYTVCKSAPERPAATQPLKKEKESEWIPILIALVVLSLTALTAAALYLGLRGYL